ncbi:hypothetical protein [Streptomyces sp. DHE17-7]|uniref:hypothetical protein n=1 Tax=Streptomyces sp. DHE17-7 TaxID=2759949 RepID=UPI0022EB7521|nr:hypothetical protein [Streptomyces sp. DHE17-7]
MADAAHAGRVSCRLQRARAAGAAIATETIVRVAAGLAWTDVASPGKFDLRDVGAFAQHGDPVAQLDRLVEVVLVT